MKKKNLIIIPIQIIIILIIKMILLIWNCLNIIKIEKIFIIIISNKIYPIDNNKVNNDLSQEIQNNILGSALKKVKLFNY